MLTRKTKATDEETGVSCTLWIGSAGRARQMAPTVISLHGVAPVISLSGSVRTWTTEVRCTTRSVRHRLSTRADEGVGRVLDCWKQGAETWAQVRASCGLFRRWLP
jgi:hypothetical protein